MTAIDVTTTSIKPSMAACACGDCGCNANSKYHDCLVADRIFKQLSPDIVSKLGSEKDYDTLLSYQSFENGSITIKIDIKPKEPPSSKSHPCHDKNCVKDGEKTNNKNNLKHKLDSGCCKHKSAKDCEDDKKAAGSPPGKVQKLATTIKHFYENPRNKEIEEEHIDVEEVDDRKVTDTSKKYKCPDCDKQFEYKSTLERHSKTVHQHEKPHECPVEDCDKRFGLKHHLDRHQRQVHGDDRPHECPEANCGKKFKDKYNMQVHRRIHTGLKPFKCPSVDCGKSFNQKGSFNNHIKTHKELVIMKDEKQGLIAVPYENLEGMLNPGLNPISGAQISQFNQNTNNNQNSNNFIPNNQNNNNQISPPSIQNRQHNQNNNNNQISQHNLEGLTFPQLPPIRPNNQFFNSTNNNSNILQRQPESGIPNLPELNDMNACGENCGCADDTPCLINHMSGDKCCT